jgi:hypothetical protein
MPPVPFRENAKAGKMEKKPILKLVKEVVELWETMQPRKSTPESRKLIAEKVISTGKGHLKQLSMHHSSSRAIQAALKHGGPAVREGVWAECKGSVLEMALSPHGSFALRKLIVLAEKRHIKGRCQIWDIGRVCCSSAWSLLMDRRQESAS